MTNNPSTPVSELIARSSLGTSAARRVRARVPLSTGRAVAAAAAARSAVSPTKTSAKSRQT